MGVAQVAVGCVLDHQEVLFAGERHDRVHLAAHAGVVDRDDGFGFVGDGGFNQGFVEIEGIEADVDEHRHSAADGEGIGGGDEGVGWHDHFVNRPVSNSSSVIVMTERNRLGAGMRSAQATTFGLALFALTLHSSEITLVSSKYIRIDQPGDKAYIPANT